MSRIAECFNDLKARGRKAVIPYIVAGDPGVEITVDLMLALVESGADIIELGVPFSDPMSEGPVIQRGHERALERGMRLRGVLDVMVEFRKHNQKTPVLLMGYANPVEHMGHAQFADRAAASGVDALLTVDIPPEEVAGLNHELRRVGMDNIFLIAPTTPADRMDLIAEEASGFIYYVSLKGVTGAGNLDREAVARSVAEIRSHTTLPICVGFGIKDGPSAAAVAAVSDGVVIGSALVQRLADVAKEGGDDAAVLAAARAMLTDIREHVDGNFSDAA
ncbi:tryptophan synthase subunit alpha [Congregibacter variabilis]|uniref:Tryptophan synthase alpha chain n=1 Tax=Congregibacter variabilis TaxID=3081200 RepID=A0ABZ0I488_9GAMM|nr:tryptophan synthase subunit alpha [Congregibacter sp. IMCC43200]